MRTKFLVTAITVTGLLGSGYAFGEVEAESTHKVRKTHRHNPVTGSTTDGVVTKDSAKHPDGSTQKVETEDKVKTHYDGSVDHKKTVESEATPPK